MKRVSVFCGSSAGKRPVYQKVATQVGRLIAHRGLELVYGGGHIGLMGAVADGALAEGGRVIGVIPQALVDRELAHQGVTEMRVVGSMHERKACMADLSDGFLALPGGFGTLEELTEVVTWAQLGIHRKPCALLNVDGYFDGFLKTIDHAAAEGFMSEQARALLMIGDDPKAVLEQMAAYRPPDLPQWVSREES